MFQALELDFGKAQADYFIMKQCINFLAAFVVIMALGCESTSASKTKPAIENKDQEEVVDNEVPLKSMSKIEEVVYGDKFPEVLAVKATRRKDEKWNVSVTLSSTYDTRDRYADAWRVLDKKGKELGIRILGHHHANEQPFTRSGVIRIPKETKVVFIEGRDKANGWSGQRFEMKVPTL